MDLDQLAEYRKTRLRAFIALKFEGSKAALGRALGYRDGAFVGQMLSGLRPITEKTINQIQALPGGDGWFSISGAEFDPLHGFFRLEDAINHIQQTPEYGPSISKRIEDARIEFAARNSKPDVLINARTKPTIGPLINLLENPDYPAIRRVRFKLSAGASGFAVDYVDDDAAPIVFQRKWFESHGYAPDKLLAIPVANGSMEPGLHDGDTVVINTADTNLKDGEVFAMNYEGELVVKRLIRDAGQWWLASDNPDQRRYPRKVCGEDVFCLGRIVHKQSEKI